MAWGVLGEVKAAWREIRDTRCRSERVVGREVEGNGERIVGGVDGGGVDGGGVAGGGELFREKRGRLGGRVVGA